MGIVYAFRFLFGFAHRTVTDEILIAKVRQFICYSSGSYSNVNDLAKGKIELQVLYKNIPGIRGLGL